MIRKLASMSLPALPSVERQAQLKQAYDAVYHQVQEVSSRYEKSQVNLVAVSKLKPASDILALYEHGVRHFGENYVQELVEKSAQLPKDIKWHFIGGLQTGKCKDLAKNVQSLYAVETVDNLKKCKKLNSTRKDVNGEIINVYLQINTSNEDQKSGFLLEDKESLYETVEFLLGEESTHVNFEGLMTIGSFTESTSSEENKDFKNLVELKKHLDEKYRLNLRLSMGMSNDYEDAIRQGSTSVRVGTSIFGVRPPKN